MNIFRFVSAALVSGLLVACGGGGGGGNPDPPPVTPAPSALSYPAPPVLTVGTAMTALAPTVTGNVATYTVAPALPAGLAINGTSGIISGTPTAPGAAANYTVTAGNAGGTTAAVVSIAVNDRAPAFTYPGAALVFSEGVVIAPLTPASTGGAVTQWTVTPALPAGLAIDAATGVISGTPAAATAAASYQVRGQNSGGQATFDLSITVTSGVLLDLGHSLPVRQLRANATRVLSYDTARWNLWNRVTGALIARGYANCTQNACGARALAVDMAGNTFAYDRTAYFDIRDTADGALLARITTPITWWSLASDGSYVVVGNANNLSAWSRAGTPLFSIAGDYSAVSVDAAPGEVRVANAPGNAQAIQRVSVAGGAITAAPFLGQFNSWFVDGGRFLTQVGTLVRVYEADGTLADQAMLADQSNLAGQGNFIRSGPTYGPTFYRVGASASPALTIAMNPNAARYQSGARLGYFAQANRVLSLFDLSGTTIVRTDHTLPSDGQGDAFGLGAVAAGSDTDFVSGDGNGRVLEGTSLAGTPRYLGVGKVLDTATSASRIAVATADGNTRVFDAVTRALERTLPVANNNLEISTDGNRLVIGPVDRQGVIGTEPFVRVFDLVTGSETYTWPANPGLVYFRMAGAGNVLARITRVSSGNYTRDVVPVLGGTPIFSDSIGTPDRLTPAVSPGGQGLAVVPGIATPTVGTNLYLAGVLQTVVPGSIPFWLDDGRVLVEGTGADVNRHVIFDSAGTRLGAVSLAAVPEPIAQVATPNSVYRNVYGIFSLTTGAQVWTSSTGFSEGEQWGPRNGSVGGPFVTYEYLGFVRAEAHGQ